MKVLCFSENFLFITTRLFLGFVRKLEKYCEFKVYGKMTYEVDKTEYRFPKELMVKEYNEKISASDLLKEYKADVFLVILHNKSVIKWLPVDIKKVGVPVVILEDDFYTYDPELSKYKGTEVLDWYKNNKVDLLLRRHFHRDKAPVPSVWFPQSANEEEFEPYYGHRENCIGFAGSFSPTPWYTIRRQAILELLNAKLLHEIYGKVSPKDYPRYIKTFKGILGCSGGILHVPLAKMFECMLTNTPYLTNWFHHSHILFGLKECCFIYKDDCSDVVDKAKIILNDHDYVEEVTKNALGIVKDKHLDRIRIKELYDILCALVGGKEIPNKWGN